MPDIMTTEERSKRMSLIRSRDTKPELKLRQALHRLGCRYRIHDSTLPGKPDIVFPKRRVLVFVNGCFWHGHKCPTGHIPKSNSEFWSEKITKNRRRDAQNIRKLRSCGWKVIVIWECKIRMKGTVEKIAYQICHLVRR